MRLTVQQPANGGSSGTSSYITAGFGAFVNTTATMTATTSTGTPSAGTFYSSITGRSSMKDLSQDLNSRFGNNRIMTQQLIPLYKEVGSTSQPVYSVVNDRFNQIRFVGAGWTTTAGTNGMSLTTTSTTDFVEITIYGTHLNVLTSLGGTRDFRARVDGGAEGGNLVGFTGSTFMDGRGYALNQSIAAASALTEGVHTITLRNNTATGFTVYGFETSIVDATPANIVTNTGFGYANSAQVQLAAQNKSSYTNSVTGTRGGRIVRYLDTGGTIANAFQAVDASTLTLASAVHTNEEVAQVFHFREFGANRTDDFSTLQGSSNRAFTLNDGTTTLYVNNGVATTNTTDTIAYDTGVLTFTIEGCGLDVYHITNNATSRTMGLTINGTSFGTFNVASNATASTIKLASGLPYGTHTVQISQNTNGTASWLYFLVYQPKKPSIPSGAIELADFNVLATFVANNTNTNFTRATGILRKPITRETAFVGTWTFGSIDGSNLCGWNIFTSTNGDYIQHRFFGTGFDYRTVGGASTYTATVEVDGSTNLSSFTTGSYGAIASFVAATGVYTTSAGASTYGNGVYVSGLTLGWHTVRITKTSGAGSMNPEALDLITPTHAYSNVVPYDRQNTYPVGSLSIADTRKFSPVSIENLVGAVSNAVGITSGPTTTSSALLPVPDLSVKHLSQTGRIKVSYSITAQNSSVGAGWSYQIFIDGVAFGNVKSETAAVANSIQTTADTKVFYVAPGERKIDVFWNTTGGTLTATGTNRDLLIEDIT